jgi:hypothetical protein
MYEETLRNKKENKEQSIVIEEDRMRKHERI